ncbi:hypothetical protein GGQ85_003963 [Nitrobacter vulgaris]|nr:hypothetical protein [Nitrobacter vulgaris]
MLILPRGAYAAHHVARMTTQPDVLVDALALHFAGR